MIQIWILTFWLCNTLFFLLSSVETSLQLTLVVALNSSLPSIARYRLSGDCMKNLWSLFLHVPSSLDKELTEKPTFVQVGSFCISILSSGTALQQDFVIHKVWRTSLKRFGTIMQKILHCDLLHLSMFHDKKSCRKTTFLSFNVGKVIIVCITFGSWIQ